jgi:hypothetical protein
MPKRSVGVAVGLNLLLGLNHAFDLSATGGDPLAQLQTRFGAPIAMLLPYQTMCETSTSPQCDLRYSATSRR